MSSLHMSLECGLQWLRVLVPLDDLGSHPVEGLKKLVLSWPSSASFRRIHYEHLVLHILQLKISSFLSWCRVLSMLALEDQLKRGHLLSSESERETYKKREVVQFPTHTLSTSHDSINLNKINDSSLIIYNP